MLLISSYLMIYTLQQEVPSQIHPQVFCFWIILKYLTKDASETVWIGLKGQVFTNYDSVLLLLICDTVWNNFLYNFSFLISSCTI